MVGRNNIYTLKTGIIIENGDLIPNFYKLFMYLDIKYTYITLCHVRLRSSTVW